ASRDKGFTGREFGERRFNIAGFNRSCHYPSKLVRIVLSPSTYANYLVTCRSKDLFAASVFFFCFTFAASSDALVEILRFAGRVALCVDEDETHRVDSFTPNECRTEINDIILVNIIWQGDGVRLAYRPVVGERCRPCGHTKSSVASRTHALVAVDVSACLCVGRVLQIRNHEHKSPFFKSGPPSCLTCGPIANQANLQILPACLLCFKFNLRRVPTTFPQGA